MTETSEIKLTEWECGRIAQWAAVNALTYMGHNTIGRGLNADEKVEMEHWKALSDKFRRATAAPAGEGV